MSEKPTTPELIWRDDAGEIWWGDSLDAGHVQVVMGDRVADLLCVDAPYSSRTHQGHKRGKLTADRAAAFGAGDGGRARKRERAYSARKAAQGESGRRDLEYAFWSPCDVDRFVELWALRRRGWIVTITDDVLAPAWRSAFEVEDLYPFAPLPLVETGSRVRMSGDGPSNWTCWIVVARPRNREFSKWGTLPGAYVQPGEREINATGGTDRIVGGKPQQSKHGLVRDYSRAGDLVLDPACGAGTTLLAARIMGRRCIGVDVDRARCELAARRMERAARQMPMPWAGEKTSFIQPDLFSTIEAAQ